MPSNNNPDEILDVKLPLSSWLLLIEATKQSASDMGDDVLEEIADKIKIQVDDEPEPREVRE